MIKLLHFSDAHIDIASQGKRDPQSGLPIRVLDFLKALDTIVDTAINEKVDLVIFAGDAYKDRTPVPTFQREWGKRIMRLSQAKIPTILLVGNHDISPAAGRATTLQEFNTLLVPNVHLVVKPEFISSQQLNNLPIQIVAIPWITRSGFLTAHQDELKNLDEIDMNIEAITSQIIDNLIEKIDPEIPTILTAHASVQGAIFGAERSIMLGHDIVLPINLVKRQEFDYVALGHIHKAQNLNEDAHPPVIYSGSIERVDFGEAEDEKMFVIAEID
jgi:exonuclease SbcD